MKMLSLLVAATLAAGYATVGKAESVTLDAYSVWSATGTVLATGPESHGFAGEMRGPYFIDVGEGAIPAGEIACIGMLSANERTGAQTGSGECSLMATDGAVSFARFTCEGFRLVGCVGRFELTGGEGRMAGARGEGPIVLRRFETAFTGDTEGRVTEQGYGIASWKGFTVTMEAPPQ